MHAAVVEAGHGQADGRQVVLPAAVCTVMSGAGLGQQQGVRSAASTPHAQLVGGSEAQPAQPFSQTTG